MLELGKWVNFNRVLGEPKNEGKVLTVRAKSPILRPRRFLNIAPKSIIIKPADSEEAKINEQTASVAAVATGFVVASATVMITNGLPIAQPNIDEAVTTKEKEDHSVDIPAIEAVSTRSAQPRRYLNQT